MMIQQCCLLMNKSILTFDISTSIIGVSYISFKENGFKINWTKPIIFKTEKNEFAKLDTFKTFINSLKVKPTDIIIEAPLKFSNNQNTVAKLLFFNGLCSSFLYSKWNIIPQYINPGKARKTAFPEVKFGRRTAEIKEQVLECVKTAFPSLILPKNLSQFDCADSVVLGLAYINMLKN